ncbi:hypothetical protein IKN40_05570 [bacterium]|nr:hypothetical protein [bacterium]
MRRFIDEFLEPTERQWLEPNFEDIKNKVFDYFNNGLNLEEIVKQLQKDLYIFDDERETKWETEVVYRILEGQSIKNRFTGITFN